MLGRYKTTYVQAQRGLGPFDTIIYHDKFCCFIVRMKKKSKKEKNAFRKELDDYVRKGIPLWLDGNPSTPGEIEKAHKIAEDVTYMRDYVQDSKGHLTRLEFGKVKEE